MEDLKEYQSREKYFINENTSLKYSESIIQLSITKNNQSTKHSQGNEKGGCVHLSICIFAFRSDRWEKWAHATQS